MMRIAQVPEAQAAHVEAELRGYIGRQELSFCARLEEDRVMFVYPIAVMSAAKSATLA